VWFASFIILTRYFSFSISFIAASVKVLIPFFYFAFFINTSWMLLDDVTYVKGGMELLGRGNNPFTIFFDPIGRMKLFQLAGGHHILYYWWNMLGQYFFGSHYYSSVFLNILTTVIGGVFLYKIAIECGFSQKYSKILFLFFLLHWEVLTWASLINLKDTLVMVLTIVAFYYILNVSKNPRNIRVWILALLAIILFFWIRFYIPIVILSALCLWAAFFRKGIYRILMIVASIALFGFIYHYIGSSSLLIHFNKFIFHLYGVFRAALTPQPWQIESGYSFLVPASTLHWLFFIPMIIGGWCLWRNSKEARLFLTYFALILLLYGSYTALQGPRHRFQVTFVIAWMQFHFIWIIAEKSVLFQKITDSLSRSTQRVKPA